MQVVVRDSDKVVAACLGWKGFGRIYVTKGALSLWDEAELDAVLAHERAHLDHFHVLGKLVLMVSLHVFRAHLLIDAKTDDERDSAMIKVLVLRFVVLNLYSYLIERSADRSAYRLGHGRALASALGKFPHKRSHVVPALLMGAYHPLVKGRMKRLTK